MNDSTLMPPPEFLLNLLIKHLQQVPGRRRLQRKTFSRKRAECELTSKIIFGAHRPNRKNSIAPCYLLLINQDMRLWWAWPHSTLRGKCLFTKKLFISADLTLKMVKSDLKEIRWISIFDFIVDRSFSLTGVSGGSRDGVVWRILNLVGSPWPKACRPVSRAATNWNTRQTFATEKKHSGNCYDCEPVVIIVTSSPPWPLMDVAVPVTWRLFSRRYSFSVVIVNALTPGCFYLLPGVSNMPNDYAYQRTQNNE